MNGDCTILVQGVPDGGDDVRVELATESETHEECYNGVFEEYDCPVVIADVSASRIRVHTYPPNRDTLKDLVDDLGRIGDVTVTRIVDMHSDDEICDLRTVNFGRLTSMERETITEAVVVGYYDRPRNADLEVLADRFDVSKSTVSQRLRSAERKIVVDLLIDTRECIDETESRS